MKKFITTMTVLALSASVLAGCGKTAENGESTQAGTESAAPAETGSETAAAAVEYGEDAYVDGINVADYVTLGEYKGIEVTETTPTVTDDYVQSYIDYALQSNMVTTEVTDRAVQTGDFANIDYEGKIDGVAFEGGTDKGYDLEIGSGSFIDGFEDGLIGAEIGETRDVTVTFPESYPNAEVAGKEAVFTVTVNSIHTESLPELTDECDRFCRYAQRIIGAVVTVGIGQVCGRLTGLAQSYSSAREAVSYRVIYGVSRAINMKEIAPKEMSKSDGTLDAELLNLFGMIRLNSDEDIIKAARRYMKHISCPAQSLQQYHIDLMDLISALYRFAVNNDIEVPEFTGNIRNLYIRILDLEPEALEKWLIDICLLLRETLISARSKSTQSFVFRAKEYVASHYSDEEISLDNICEMLGVSNSYFSTVFKKETGNSFIGYLTEYRMERASRMLIETNEKSYIIAKNVGYTDPNYFSYVFKRRFGVSPSKYRMEHGSCEK